MNKQQLQQIFSTEFNAESWQQVLREVFGVKTLLQIPSPIILNANDLAESAVELGSCSTADERLIGLYQVNLNANVRIEQNKVGVRELLRSIYKYDVDGALVVFVQNGGNATVKERVSANENTLTNVRVSANGKWRFSYISEIRVLNDDGTIETKATEPKRFTYLFGKGENCRTALERFEKLNGKPIHLQDLTEAFSVEKLNKQFFKDYKEFFEKFSRHLAESSEYRKILLGSDETLAKGFNDETAKPIRDFAKILLGRIVFLQFLQKKSWLGVSATQTDWTNGDSRFIQNLFAKFPDKNKFHSTALKTLFFETLNRKRENDLASDTLGENIKIPYLNGGLFDEDISAKFAIDFPSTLFHELLEFFEQYNFTIDENDPLDSEVGIDPEMLGHIFENLLEENRQKGAFYTPKEIVKYMCQESLIEYLKTFRVQTVQSPTVQSPTVQSPNFSLPPSRFADGRHDKSWTLNEDEEHDKSWTLNGSEEMLVRQNRVSDEIQNNPKLANELNNLLKKVKICDPAIGSGAFPMGLLNEIFRCRQLLYGYLRTNQPFNPGDVKREIIQNNIYGVDLENGAVDIARLRFWLALVVDEITPQPLPNLDYKIMQGNSLLERFDDIDLSKLIETNDEIDSGMMITDQLNFGEGLAFPVQMTIFDQATKQTLESLIKQYFNVGESITKSDLKRQINDLVEGKIHAYLFAEKHKLEGKINAYERKLGITKETDLSQLNQKTKDFKTYLKDKEQLARFDATEAKLIELQHTEAKPYFLWHFWFKDVFDNGGFDIVIGNPPYIQLQKLGANTANYEKAGFQTFTRTGDIYCLFYEQGNNLLRNGGNLSFITSNSWMRTQYGESLRKYFTEKMNPIRLVNVEDTQIFTSATVESNLILLKKEKWMKNLKAVSLKNDYRIDLPIEEYFRINSIQITELPLNGWIIGNEIENKLKLKIEKDSTRLSECNYQIKYGVKTGLNEAFFIDTEKKNELIRQDPTCQEVIKPALRGKDITKYNYQWKDIWVILIKAGWTNANRKNVEPEQFFKQKYPSIYNHFKEVGENFQGKGKGLFKREDQGDYWWELRPCVYYDSFEKEKIVWGELSDQQKFAFDNLGMFANNTIFFMTGKDLKYLLSILNSSLSKWYFNVISTSSGMGTNRWLKYKIEQLPIKQISSELQQPFAEIVEQILALKKADKQAETKELENKIDKLVYDLYELTAAEIAIVEGRSESKL